MIQRNTHIKATIRLYYRLTKPGIIYGNLITVIAGFIFASMNGFDFGLFLATVVGVALVIAAGCVINNVTDRHIDAKMDRTKNRAIVAGIISVKAALIYGTILGLAGMVVLAVCTNYLVVLIGIIGFIDYVVLYAIAKRKSVYSTFVGTVSGAAPLVAGYVAVTGSFDIGALLLFLVMLWWQMAHFYAIAIFRMRDYKAASIPVLSVVKGIQITKRQIIVYIVLFTFTVAAMPLFGYGGYVFGIVMTAVGLCWLYISLQGLHQQLAAAKWAKKVFRFSLIVLLALSVMLSLTNLLP